MVGAVDVVGHVVEPVDVVELVVDDVGLAVDDVEPADVDGGLVVEIAVESVADGGDAASAAAAVDA